METLMLKIFFLIGSVSVIVASSLVVLLGIVLCLQLFWWIFKQTQAWVEILSVVKRYKRLFRRMKKNEKALK